MKTIAKKTFKKPFVLTEQELRRIHDVLDQQIQRVLPAEDVATFYELTFANGVVANPTSLDEIFAQENLGSKAIRTVELGIGEVLPPPSAQRVAPKSAIRVQFLIPEEGDRASIRYDIRGEDRDWVFVSSSQLEERIGRVVGGVSFEALSNVKGLGPLVVMLGALLGGLFVLSFMLQEVNRVEREHEIAFQKVYSDYQQGKIKDPIAIQFELQRINTGAQLETPPSFVVKSAGLAVLVMIIVVGVPFLWRYFSPPFNFVWGDYQNVFEKRRARGRFVLVGVRVAVMVGVVANVLTKKIGF